MMVVVKLSHVCFVFFEIFTDTVFWEKGRRKIGNNYCLGFLSKTFLIKIVIQD